MPNEKAEKLQQDGQHAYRTKQFNSALELFSQALAIPEISPMLQIRILDNRAAAQEKIGGPELLRAALADAKKMIQLQKTSANGYLRAGKILQLQGSDKLALDLYKYGLKRIASNDDKGKKLLEGMHQKVLSRVEGPKAAKCCDMMSILPLELVEMILHHLPFHTLMLAQSVSKPWRQFLTTRYQTYNIVDFAAAKRPVSKYAFRTCVKRSKGNITKLITNRLGFPDSEPLIYLASRCKGLSHVEIRGNGFTSLSIVEMTKVASNLKTLVVDCTTSIGGIAAVLDQCHTLESLECSDVIASNTSPLLWDPTNKRILRRLLLSSTLSLSRALGLPNLLKQLPALQELELFCWYESIPLPPAYFDFSALENLKILTLARIHDLKRLPMLPPTIQKLDLSGNPHLVCTLDDITASPLPNLESLDVGSNPKIKNSLILALLEPSLEHHRLRALRMNMCPCLDFDSLDWLLDVGHGEKLTELAVAGNSTFGDQVSKELGRLKALKKLDVANTRVTGIGVLNLVGKSENTIEWLCLDGCESVGRDVVQLVRGMGISVSHRFTGDLKGGKKIRYRD